MENDNGLIGQIVQVQRLTALRSRLESGEASTWNSTRGRERCRASIAPPTTVECPHNPSPGLNTAGPGTLAGDVVGEQSLGLYA